MNEKQQIVFIPVSQPRQINSIFTIKRPILYIYVIFVPPHSLY